MTNTVTLPWPPRECSLNARVHHMMLHKAKGRYKDMCYWLAKKAQLQSPQSPVVSIDFFPPDRRRRDVDNVLASCKAGIDGIAQAVGIDDSNFRDYRLSMKEQVGGYVVVTFLEKVTANDSNT